jgi:hypothetical protein
MVHLEVVVFTKPGGLLRVAHHDKVVSIMICEYLPRQVELDRTAQGNKPNCSRGQQSQGLVFDANCPVTAYVGHAMSRA